MNSGQKSNIRKISVLLFLASFFCFFVSCQTTKPASNNAELVNLANELEEANQKIEEIYHRMSVVQFMVDNHERTITDLENNLKPGNTGSMTEKNVKFAAEYEEIPAVIAEDTSANDILAPESKPDITEKESIQYKSPEFIYNKGFSALKSKNYTKAVSMFKSIVSKYPAHNLADNAIYWTGEIYYTQRDFPEAIRTFNRLIEQYPEGGKVPDSLLKIGYSYYSMKDKDNAVKYLKKVVVDYPFSVSGSKAEAMLHKIE